MATATASSKTECLNPNTGRRMNINKEIYDRFSKAIYHTLKKGKSLSFSEVLDGVKDCFKQEGYRFPGSISWYCITVINDLESRKVIEAYKEKGKKLHRLAPVKK